MIRFLVLAILIILVARAFWRVVDGIIEGAGGRAPRGSVPGGRGGTKAVKLVRDPVCGTYVAQRTSLSASSDGTTHYFCSDKCKREYLERR